MRNRLYLSFKIIKGHKPRTSYFNIKDLSREDYLSTLGFKVEKTWELKGKVVSGAQQASFFTQLEWVQNQCMEKLGFRPYPGTLNLKLEMADENRESILELSRENGIKLIPPDPKFCPAILLPVFIGEKIKGAIVMPSEEVNIQEKRILEVMAPLRLRDILGVKDGDVVALNLGKYT